MLFDIGTEDGQWFPFFGSRVDAKTGDVLYEDATGDARVKIRSLRPFLERVVSKRKRTVEHIYNPKTRSMDRVVFSPELTPEEATAERNDAWDYAIVELENFKNKATGEVIATTRDTKIRLMAVPVFDRFFVRCQELLGDMAVSHEEDVRKNS